MGDSYINLLYHIVFSTKDRRPLLTAEYELRLYDYIGGTIRDLGGISLALNGNRGSPSPFSKAAARSRAFGCPQEVESERQRMDAPGPSATRGFHLAAWIWGVHRKSIKFS